jgi:hypothetical protein
MQANDGMFRVSVNLAAGAYYSVINSLSANHFKQIKVHVRNLRFSRGNVDGIEFEAEETPQDELH